MKKKLYILLCSLMLALTAAAQQDPQYNLYQFNQMVINPAFAGSKDNLSVILATRQQWVSFSGAPKTTCLSLHAPVWKKNLGLGLTVVNDVLGPRNFVGVYGNVAYIAKLNRKLKLSFGLNGGYNRYQFNFGKVEFSGTDEIPTAFYQNQIKNTFDMDAGLFLRSHKFFVGLSSTHLTVPSIYSYDNSDTAATKNKFAYRLRNHVFLTAGYSYKINDNVIFAPTIMIREAKNNWGGDINLNFFLYKKLWLGIFYRGGYGLGGLLQYHITDKVRVAYSFDSGIKDAFKLGGSHEIMLGYDFAKKQKGRVTSPRFL